MDELARLEIRLTDLNARLAAWNAQVNAAFAKLDPWQPSNTAEDVSAAIRQAHTEVGPGPQTELRDFLDELGDSYLAASAAQREAIRRIVGENPAVLNALYGYIGSAAERLQETGDPRWLRLGLAAASIEDARIDFRDLFQELGNLYATAYHARINPQPYFQEIARLSRADSRGTPIFGLGGMRSFLAHFHHSEYFRREVRPLL